MDVQADKKSKEAMQTCTHVLKKCRCGLAFKVRGAGRRSALWRLRRGPTPSTPAQAPSAKQALQSSNNGLPAKEMGVQEHLASSEASAASSPRTANSPPTPAYPPLNMIQVNSFNPSEGRSRGFAPLQECSCLLDCTHALWNLLPSASLS